MADIRTEEHTVFVNRMMYLHLMVVEP